MTGGSPARGLSVPAPATHLPRPVTRSSLLRFVTRQQTFSPLILTLGIHSTTLDTYAGGPGTVGIHTWGFTPTGQPASHGCIRVPAAALPVLAQVPLGTLVRITGNGP